MSDTVKCKRCINGKIRRDTCATCKGSGRVRVITDENGAKTVVPAPAERP